MKIKVSVPATSANIGSGFDALGLACLLYTSPRGADGKAFAPADGCGRTLHGVGADGDSHQRGSVLRSRLIDGHDAGTGSTDAGQKALRCV